MNQKIDRRNLLKSGLLTLGGAIAYPALSKNSVPAETFDKYVISPMVTEHVLEQEGKGKLIRINANENPYGPPKSVYKAMESQIPKGNRYVWDELGELTARIAKKEGVKPENVMIGPGSSDLLEKIALVTFQKGGNIISADPCFTFIAETAASLGGGWKSIPCRPDWSHDLEAMEKAIDKDTKMVYICNPNNPTGSITKGKELLDFCNRVSEKVPVFIDEAYLELATNADTQSMISLVRQNKNVIIARTFSKVMGMAGMRIGYVVAQPEFLKPIKKIIARAGMGLSGASIYAAFAALDDTEFQAMTIKLNNEVKDYVCKNLDKMGYKYIPSHTSFILFPINMPGKDLLSKMAAKGLGVRALDLLNKPWCRVSLGTMDEMKQFIGALESIS